MEGQEKQNQETQGCRLCLEGCANGYGTDDHLLLELFTRDPKIEFGELLNLLQVRVSTEMNESMCKEFTKEEIGDALFQVEPLKAPSIDGFSARFYQRNWATLKAEVVNAVKLLFPYREDDIGCE
jgi:hypothetical protein